MFKSSFQTPSRRSFLKSSIAGAAVAVALPAGAFAQDGKVLKVAGIYTVPVEQQWVSRIHIAATAAQEAGDIEYTYSENTANTDYPRVMREYAEQGYDLIVGEIFGVEAEAREVAADYPDVAFLMGSSFGALEALHYTLASKNHEIRGLILQVCGGSTYTKVS